MTISKAWQRRMAQAQRDPTVVLAGTVYQRVPYGEEYPDRSRSDYRATCPDCAVELGQLHVPSCCVEACPRCMGQAFGCPCFGDDAPPLATDRIH